MRQVFDIQFRLYVESERVLSADDVTRLVRGAVQFPNARSTGFTTIAVVGETEICPKTGVAVSSCNICSGKMCLKCGKGCWNNEANCTHNKEDRHGQPERGAMIEVALVFDKDGKPIHWHVPPGVSSGAIPDSRSLWDVLWENRKRLGGVAHTHPWNGIPVPSGTDETTWAAIEAGLGVRLWWPIVTMDNVRYYAWNEDGYKTQHVVDGSGGEHWDDNIEELRRRSRQGG